MSIATNKKEIILNPLVINLFCVAVCLAAALVFGGAFCLRWHVNISAVLATAAEKKITLYDRVLGGLWGLIIALVGGIIHELIHGLCYAHFAKNKWKSVRFGLLLKKGIAYCICMEPIKIKHVIIVGIMPAIILGFIPALLSLIIPFPFLLFFGILFTGGATGDFWIVRLLLKEPPDAYTQDNPDGKSFVIYYDSIPQQETIMTGA